MITFSCPPREPTDLRRLVLHECFGGNDKYELNDPSFHWAYGTIVLAIWNRGWLNTTCLRMTRLLKIVDLWLLYSAILFCFSFTVLHIDRRVVPYTTQNDSWKGLYFTLMVNKIHNKEEATKSYKFCKDDRKKITTVRDAMVCSTDGRSENGGTVTVNYERCPTAICYRTYCSPNCGDTF